MTTLETWIGSPSAFLQISLRPARAAWCRSTYDLAKGALVLAGLSEEARNLAIAKSLSPGGPINSLTLLNALGDDVAADGFFDGVGAANIRIQVPSGSANGYALDGQTVRATLAQGITTFLANPLNMSKIATADAQGLVTEIGTDSNSQLFRSSSGNVDLVPPTIQFVQPGANASVHGSVTVEAVASDNVAVSSFTFTAPSALTNVQATPESNGTSMHLIATLDVSALPDGVAHHQRASNGQPLRTRRPRASSSTSRITDR